MLRVAADDERGAGGTGRRELDEDGDEKRRKDGELSHAGASSFEPAAQAVYRRSWVIRTLATRPPWGVKTVTMWEGGVCAVPFQ